MGQSEIQSSVIGRKVMDELKELDKIAYIRFAQYTNLKKLVNLVNILMSYMESKRNKVQAKHIENLTLAFEKAKINLGSTKENPSVGCVVEKDGSIISSGYASLVAVMLSLIL